MDTHQRLAFAPFDSPHRATVLPDASEEELEAHWHLVTRDGRDLTGGRAGVALLTELRSTRWLGRALDRLRLWPVVGAVDWVLDKARGKLGKLVPDGPAPERFP